MMIYLAGPIDHVPADSDAVGFGRGCAARAFRLEELAWFDPAKPYGSPMSDPEATYRINEAALRESDGLLALLPPGVPSTGTPMEIQRAYDAGKPVAVVGGNGSMQLMGMGVWRADWTNDAEPIIAAIRWLKTCAHDRVVSDHLIKYIGDPEYEPRSGYPGDAGFDLVVSEDTQIPYDGFADVPCGLSIELPQGVWAMVTGRSSTIRRRKLLVSQAIIDQGYRGPIFAGVWNLGEAKYEAKRGERIAQLIPFPLLSARLQFERVETLGPSARGESAFGSTG